MPTNSNDNVNNNKANNIFIMKDTKFCVTIVTLSTRNNQKLPKLLSKKLGRSVYWNKYKTKIEDKNMTNEYGYRYRHYLVGVTRLFVFVF